MGGGGGGGDFAGKSTDSAGRANGPPPGPGGSNSQASMQAAMARMADIPAANFPAAKPAVPSSGTIVAAAFDANGMLWVARERVHGDVVPHYDVIAEGKGVVGHVNLPPKSRLVGFGKGVDVSRAHRQRSGVAGAVSDAEVLAGGRWLVAARGAAISHQPISH